jgi:phage virion morphogenesis protein
MDGVRMEISLNGLKGLDGRVSDILGRAQDLRPLMQEVARFGEVTTKLRFRSETGPDGVKWQPSYRAKTKGGKTLVDSGNLRSSLSSFATAKEAMWGTNLIYANIHQFGGVIKAKAGKYLKFSLPGLGFRSVEEVTIPKRSFLGVNADDREAITDLIIDHYNGGVA